VYRAIRGLFLTFLCFAAAFALHVVGGATDQGWLFAIAVGLIFLIATGYSGFALWFAGLAYAGDRAANVTDLAGGVVGSALTLGALWAANDRSFAIWQFAAAPLMEAAVSAIVVFIVVRLGWAHAPAPEPQAI
jgi:hypothetical protein